MSGATLALTGTSDKGTAINNLFTEAQRTTNSSGQITLKLPAGSGYTWSTEKTVGGKSYSGTQSFNVSTSGTNAITCVLTEATDKFPVYIKAQDQNQNPVDLTGATLKYGVVGNFNPVTAANIIDGMVKFDVPTDGSKPLLLSGVTGDYQNIIADDVTIKMTKTSATTARFEVETGSSIAQIKNDGSRNYILLTLKPTVTNVKLPVPLPDTITEEDAQNLTLTFQSPNGGAPVVVNKASGGLSVETVDGTVTVTADAPLQDGTYTMTIGGSGFDPVTTPVTVLRKTETNGELTSIVNVGGTVTSGSDGNVSTVGGGITGVKANSADARGNGSANLTGDPNDSTVITKGGNITANGNDITVPDADTDPDVDPLPGGILSDPDTVTGLTPAVMKGPIYEIKSTLNPYASGGYQSLDIEVYLKNAVAGSGTFGMRFDKQLFNAPSSSDLQINDSIGLQILNGTPAYMVQDVASDYIYFYWSMKDSYGNTEVDASVDHKLIATITLNFKAGIGQADLHNNMITALNFPESQAGQDIIGIGDMEDRLEALAGYWRQKDFDGSYIFNEDSKLDADKSIGDGFYQIFHTEGENSAESYDIRMQFDLPEEVENDSVQFWVRESPEQMGRGIENAEILIYKEDGTLLTTDPLVTDRNGRAHMILPAGTYSYTITEESHWDYPDGTANNQGNTQDSFTLGSDGVITMAPLGADKITPVFDTTIYPFMDPKTIHHVQLADLANETASMNITLSSRDIAYNNVPYYFTLQPAAGYTWAKSMADVADALSAVLYETDKNGQNEAAVFHTQVGTLDPAPGQALIRWDAQREQFYITGTITGTAYGPNDLGYEALRAGDLKITVDDPDSLVKATEYRITASAGGGGTVSFVMAGNPNPSEIKETDGTTPATAAPNAYTGPATLNEKLGQGESKSATYTFTPENGGSIHKVIINGVVQPLDEEASKSAYVYQFRNVTGNQSIYVEFKTAGGTLSDANLTVASGDHGSVTVDQTGSPAPVGPMGTIEGPGTGIYSLPAGLANLGLTITPETGYKIDKVYLVKNGEKSDVTGSLSTNTADNPTTQTGAIMDLTVSGADLAALVQQGSNSTVIATFMPYDATASTQAVVTATVVHGLGTMMPAGVSVYPMGATPLYQMQPKNADWEIDNTPNSGAVLVTRDTADAAPVDYSSDVTAPDAVGGSYSYTMPALTGDTLLNVTFSEKTYRVKGQIQTVFNVLLASDPHIAPATITFSRAAVPGECAAYSFSTPSGNLAVGGGTSNLYGLLDFKANVPKGEWTVTVHKQGYLDYIISAFTVDDTGLVTDSTGESAIYFGTPAATTMKPVVLTPGDAAGDGKSIAVNDAAIVVAGWLTGATAANRIKGDIDESSFTATGSSTSGDMGHVMSNLNRVRTRQTYTDFCSAGGTN